MTEVAREVWFFNDTEALNNRYRSDLKKLFRKHGYRVSSVGLFAPLWAAPLRLIGLALRPSRPAVSSNLRTNLAVLSAVWLHGLIILNGLGRHRQSRVLRTFLIMILRVSKNKAVAVQSYADFRYFRRFARMENRLAWVPGSGGTVKAVGNGNGFVVVQRDGKLPLVAPDLIDLLGNLGADISLEVVGCHDQATALTVLPKARVRLHGVVPPSEILAFGSIFVQPSGYGEGFPHSLADALVSGMDVVIAQREFLRSGLYRLIKGRRIYNGRWIAIRANKSLRERLSCQAVNQAYIQMFEGLER